MDRVRGLITEINDIIDFSFDNLQSFESLRAWPVGEKRSINDSINVKLVDSTTTQRFLTELPPGTAFGKHWHDCTEMCTVLSGKLGDKASGKTWGIDEKAIFSKGQSHVPFNPSKTETCYLIVEFIV